MIGSAQTTSPSYLFLRTVSPTWHSSQVRREPKQHEPPSEPGTAAAADDVDLGSYFVCGISEYAKLPCIAIKSIMGRSGEVRTR